MVAYSFRKQFIRPIQAGLGILPGVPAVHQYVRDLDATRPKRQTIRGDRKRHARPGEEVQLYSGMRTKHCQLIGRARCTEVRAIVLTLEKRGHVAIGGLTHTTDNGNYTERETHYSGGALDKFAQMDGFSDWNEMILFWKQAVFVGVLIEWEPL